MTGRKPALSGIERARQRRQRRAAGVLGFVGVVVLMGFALAIAYSTGALPGSRATPTATCTPAPVTTPPQARFTVNVYNASRRTGVAGGLSQALKSRDFKVGAVGNDPYKKKLSGVGEIRFGPEGESVAKTYVLPLVPGATMVPDGRSGNTVDVAIGETFPVVPTASPTPTPDDGC